VTEIKTPDLPFVDLVFINDSTVVAVGHDCAPVLFANQGGWKLVKKLDGVGGGASEAADSGAQKSAMNIFKNKVDKAETATETKLLTKHQNAINCVQKYGGGYSTSGLDGVLLVWDAPR